MAEHIEFQYDLFIVHASADRAWVDGYLKHALGGDPARVITPHDFELGAVIPTEFERVVAASRCCLLVLSPAFLVDRWAEFGDRLVTFTSLDEGRGRVIVLKLHPCEAPPHLRYKVGLDCTQWEQWDDEVARLSEELHRAPPKPEAIPCPYPGMAAFGFENRRFFHGRDKEIDDLLEKIHFHSFLVVVGPSGSGKSSLVGAGLLPKLDDLNSFPAGTWRVRTFRPGATPLERLSEQIGGNLSGVQDAITALLESGPAAQRLLLFVDQFEELFTQVPDRETQRSFIEALKKLRTEPRCVLIVAMRADFYSDLMNSSLWPVDRSQIIEIAPLRGEALRPAIVRPAEKVGVYLEESLIDRLIADAADEPGSLPMLQEALVLLWSKRQRRLLTRAAYVALGRDGRSGLAVAMASKADATLAAMPPDEQRLARRMFLRLVQFGEGRPDTRRQLAENELRSEHESSEMFDRVLGQLIENRLLTPSSDDQGPRRIDIAHEMLIVGWPASRDWVTRRREAERTRRRLEAKCQEWDRLGRGPGGLLDEAELPEAQRWLASADAPDLGYDARLLSLVKASAFKLDHDRNAARRRVRATIASLAAGLLVVAALAVWAGLSAASARRAAQSERAARQEAMAETIQVAMGRGDWRAALRTIDQALKEGVDDPVALRLERVRALCGAQEVSQAESEIEALTKVKNLGKYEGAVLLWRGDVEWLKSYSLEGPLGLIREALRKGITGVDERRSHADREYAEGMLAVTVAGSKAHFRRAIDAMPSHQRANGMLALLLLYSGDLIGSREQIAVAEIMFPEDPTFRIMEAWATAADGRLDLANSVLDKVATVREGEKRPMIDEHQAKSARSMARIIAESRKLGFLGGFSPWLAWLRDSYSVMTQERGLLDTKGHVETRLFLPVPPVLMSYAPHARGMIPALLLSNFTHNYSQFNKTLEEVIAIDPNGLFYWLQGNILYLDESQPMLARYARAEAAFLKAAQAESFIPVRLVAKYQAMVVEYLISFEPPYDQELRKKAAGIMREIIDSGDCQPEMVRILSVIACNVDDWDRARWLLSRWRDSVPQNLHAIIEFKNHAFDRAIEAADKFLERNKNDADVLEVRSAAVSALRRLQDRVKSDHPHVSPPH